MISTNTIVNLLLLYVGKFGAVVVGFFVLPLYQQLLGSEAFGFIAVVLSLQAFLMMLDLGTSALVGRELSANQHLLSSLITWRSAELLLHTAYVALLLLALVANAYLPWHLPISYIILCIVLFWALAVQNVGQSALLAKHLCAMAASIQVVGVLFRAGITLVAMSLIRADLATFLMAQAITSVVQMLVTSWLCRRAIDPGRTTLAFNKLCARAKDLAIKGKPLMIFGLSGAAVLQLDKIIIPLFISPSALSPYFLASSLCITPISVLAGPIAQYFQPSIIASISGGDVERAQASVRKMTLAIVFAVAIPSALLWLGRDFITKLWLYQAPIATEVARYVEILLPGIAVGSLGFVPYTMLLAHQDFRMQAVLSVTLTVGTLAATIMAAAMGSVLAVCWVYTCYHVLSTVVSWLRSIHLQPLSSHNYSLSTARDALGLLAVITIVAAVLTLLSSRNLS